MQPSSMFSGKKNVLVEIVVLVAFLGILYYAYTSFSESAPTTAPTVNEQLLGQNFTLFLKAVSQEQFALDKTSFLNSEFVAQLKDFSETILPNSVRGRLDPFVPYASTRPLR